MYVSWPLPWTPSHVLFSTLHVSPHSIDISRPPPPTDFQSPFNLQRCIFWSGQNTSPFLPVSHGLPVSFSFHRNMVWPIQYTSPGLPGEVGGSSGPEVETCGESGFTRNVNPKRQHHPKVIHLLSIFGTGGYGVLAFSCFCWRRHRRFSRTACGWLTDSAATRTFLTLVAHSRGLNRFNDEYTCIPRHINTCISFISIQLFKHVHNVFFLTDIL